MVFHDKHVSAALIAQKLNLSSRAVEKQLASLKEMGVIERIGSDKSGIWKIKMDS